VEIRIGGEDGSVESFDDAFPMLFRRCRGLTYRILGDVTSAEDAAAEAMARALVHWKRISPLPYRDGWVLRVAGNLALDAARRQARPVPVPDPADAEDSADEIVVLRSALVAALAELPRRQREAIVLVHLVGLSPSEAAASMQVSVSSVGQHVRRGLDRLRREQAGGLLGTTEREVTPDAL
jgi:RNA polymerase sigma factor (sigma-70 family)